MLKNSGVEGSKFKTKLFYTERHCLKRQRKYFWLVSSKKEYQIWLDLAQETGIFIYVHIYTYMYIHMYTHIYM